MQRKVAIVIALILVSGGFQYLIATAQQGALQTASKAVAPAISGQPVQTIDAPGSPNATTTIDGRQLPPPDPKFRGVIKDGAIQSKPWWAPRIVPPQGIPAPTTVDGIQQAPIEGTSFAYTFDAKNAKEPTGIRLSISR